MGLLLALRQSAGSGTLTIVLEDAVVSIVSKVTNVATLPVTLADATVSLAGGTLTSGTIGITLADAVVSLLIPDTHIGRLEVTLADAVVLISVPPFPEQFADFATVLADAQVCIAARRAEASEGSINFALSDARVNCAGDIAA